MRYDWFERFLGGKLDSAFPLDEIDFRLFACGHEQQVDGISSTDLR
jgi:hypothetical protein